MIPLGVDTRLFHPRPAPRVPGRIVAVASADSPVKGVATLLRAFAKLTTERDAQLIVVGRPAPGGPTERLVGELALGDRVRFVHGISDTELAELAASAEIAVVPSLYEGFSLPAVEHMASGHAADGQPDRRAARGDRRTRPCWSSRATPRSSPPPCGTCSTRRPSGTGWAHGRLAAGPGTVRLAARWPGPPGRPVRRAPRLRGRPRARRPPAC